MKGNLQTGFIVYLFGRSGLEENEIFDLLEDVPFNIKDKVMSTLDIFLEKGRKLGLEEGMEKLERSKIEFVTNLIKNTDFDLFKIANLANVSVEFVMNIKSNLHS
jgi:DNA-directed RNA polymerase alpha subunit